MSEISDFEAFWEAAGERELRFQACEDCRYVRWPPSGVCPECLSREWSWRRSEGRGTIWSWVVYHRAYRGDLRERLPYNVIMVELEEGVRFVSRGCDFPDDKPVIGARVKVDFRALDGRNAVPVFVPDC